MRFLGLDPDGALLSQDVFGGAVFYLDTNVVVVALDPENSSHEWFRSLVDCVRLLGADLRVCGPTLGEFDSFVGRQLAELKKLAHSLPAGIQRKSELEYLRRFRERLDRGEDPSVEDMFAQFSNPEDQLLALYKIKSEMPLELSDPVTDRVLNEFSRHLIARQNLRGREKKPGSARHDATVLSWIARQRAESSVNCWLVTTDGSLPGAVPPGSDVSSLAVLATTLMQWIAPIAGTSDQVADFPLAFSRMTRELLLPKERLLDTRQLQMLVDSGIDLQAMPEDDVERLYWELKEHAPLLDTSTPADREHLTAILQASLTDIDLRRNQNIAKLEAEADEARRASVKAFADAEQTKSTNSLLAAKQEELTAELEAERQRGEADRRQAQIDLAKLEAEKSDLAAAARLTTLKGEARRRVVLAALLIVAVEVAIAFAAFRYGAGKNTFQRVGGAWGIMAGAIPLLLVMARFFVGKERLQALGWPFWPGGGAGGNAVS